MTRSDYETLVIRDSSILTNLYVATNIRGLNDNLELTSKNQVVLLIDFTMWDLTSLDMIIEFSSDNLEYFQETSIDTNTWSIWTVSLFEYTFIESWKFRVSFPIKDRYMRIKVKWTWTVTNSLLKITSITWLS